MSMCITQEKRDKELKKQFLKFTKVEDLRNWYFYFTEK
jgi:hypothetical protein